MSTATHAKRTFSSSPQDKSIRPAGRRRRRWPWGLALVAMVLLWLLPTLLAHSPLASWVIDKAAANLSGKLSVQRVSLGWFSPVRISQVSVHDGQGQLVLEVPQAETSRTLASLLLSPSSLGRFRLEGPSLLLVLRPDGSNLEDLLAKLPKPSARTVDLGLDIAGGTVSILDTATQRQWQIKGLEASLTLPADRQKPVEVTTSGTIDDSGRAGRFEVQLAMLRSGDPPGGNSPPNTLKVKTEGLPLDMFQSPLGRVLSNPIRLAGRLTSTIEGTWNGPSQSKAFRLRGGATAEQLRLAASALGTDELRLARLEASGLAAFQDGRLQIDQLAAQTDVGNVQASGSLEVGTSTATFLASLPQQTYHVQGQLDFARLAALLPATLRLEKDTQVTSGLLEITLDSRRGPQGMLWQGQLASSNLQAVRAGRSVVWEKPIQLSFSAHETDQGPVVENLACQSSFLKLSGSGTREQLTATATLDLDRLVDQLRGLVDLGQLRLAGTGWTQWNWTRTPEQIFRADGQLQLRRFECTLPDRPPWKEENLNAWVMATGKTDFTVDTRLDKAMFRVESGPDQLEAQLDKPVANLRDGGLWPVQVRAQGRLEQWQPRLTPWVDLNHCQFAGSHQLFVQATGSTKQLQVHRAQVTLEQLAVSGPGIRLDEPRVDLNAAGYWNWSERRAELPQLTLASQSLSAQVKQVMVAVPDQGESLITGTLHVQGDLNRIQQWIAAGGTVIPAWRLYGSLSGDLDIRQAQGKTTGNLEATIQNLAAVHTSGRSIQPLAIRVSSRGNYDPARGTVHLEQAAVTAPMAKVELGGEIASARQQPRIDMEGRLQYDLAKLSELLQALLGTSVRITGHGASPLAYHGPLDLTAAEAKASLDWTSAEMYGFRVGPGSLQASLAGGMMNCRPLDLDVNEGKVHLAPRIQFTPESSVLSVQPGRVAQQVRINPTMCASALAYITPVLAGVAAAEGRFSMELDHLQIPLEDPTRGQLGGRMLVHSIDLGPGPFVQELAPALGYSGPAQIARESTIDFQMANGRVHHRGVELKFPDVTVRTQGSVGFDKSLSLVAEMSLPPKWQTHKVVGSALRNESIQLPIAGTLDRPKIDRRVLEQYTQRFLQNATQNLLQDQLNKQLNKLFTPPPQR